uniref:Chitinase n=1 Tax=Pieris brassicae granulosis virus TaxID=10465 RepID=A0A7G9U8U3_GVPB|nr:chitinase [Pieris brassicae granulovirus]
MILKSIFVLCTLIVYCYSKPGAPQIKWGTHKYSLVELNEQAVSYNNLIVANRDSVTVSLEWDVWSGTKGTSVQLLANGVVVKNGTAQELQSQKIGYNTNEGGNFEAAIRLCDDSECSDSASVVVSVADTDGSHLNPIKYLWSENNVPFKKSPIMLWELILWNGAFTIDNIPPTKFPFLILHICCTGLYQFVAAMV